MKDERIAPERIKKHMKIYQLNEEGSGMVNKKYKELSLLDNLKELVIELHPDDKNPDCYFLIWETYVR